MLRSAIIADTPVNYKRDNCFLITKLLQTKKNGQQASVITSNIQSQKDRKLLKMR